MMKLEFNLSSNHYKLLTDISDFTGISIEEIIESIVITHIEEFDKSIEDYIKNEMGYEQEYDV